MTSPSMRGTLTDGAVELTFEMTPASARFQLNCEPEGPEVDRLIDRYKTLRRIFWGDDNDQ